MVKNSAACDFNAGKGAIIAVHGHLCDLLENFNAVHDLPEDTVLPIQGRVMAQSHEELASVAALGGIHAVGASCHGQGTLAMRQANLGLQGGLLTTSTPTGALAAILGERVTHLHKETGDRSMNRRAVIGTAFAILPESFDTARCLVRVKLDQDALAAVAQRQFDAGE